MFSDVVSASIMTQTCIFSLDSRNERVRRLLNRGLKYILYHSRASCCCFCAQWLHTPCEQNLATAIKIDIFRASFPNA